MVIWLYGYMVIYWYVYVYAYHIVSYALIIIFVKSSRRSRMAQVGIINMDTYVRKKRSHLTSASRRIISKDQRKVYPVPCCAKKKNLLACRVVHRIPRSSYLESRTIDRSLPRCYAKQSLACPTNSTPPSSS